MVKGWDGFESKINILNTGRLNIVKNLHNLNIWVTGHFESTYSAGHGWLCDENGWLVAKSGGPTEHKTLFLSVHSQYFISPPNIQYITHPHSHALLCTLFRTSSSHATLPVVVLNIEQPTCHIHNIDIPGGPPVASAAPPLLIPHLQWFSNYHEIICNM